MLIENELTNFNNLNYNKALKTFVIKEDGNLNQQMDYLDLILQLLNQKNQGRFEKPVKSFTTSQVLESTRED